MRIGVDGYNLAMPFGTGVSTYASELINALHALEHEVDGIFGVDVPRNPQLRQAVFFDRYRRPAEPPRKIRRWRRPLHTARSFLRAIGPHVAREVPLEDRAITSESSPIPRFDRLVTSGRLFEDAMYGFARTRRFITLRMSRPPRIMHWTYPIPVRLAGARNIYTLHDLVPLKLPFATLDNKETYGLLIDECLKTADHICTVSNASKQDIVTRFNVDPDRITNTYQTSSLSSDILPTSLDDDADAVESVFGLRRRGYFLYFGAIEPKKNIGRLIEAYLTLRTDTPLVIIGARAWQSEAELQLMPGGGAAGGTGTFQGPRGQTIIRLDYLPWAMLAKLIRGAKAVVFPSLYEGFGLPVLEAMQLGTPVITSDVSSLPEVAGDAGLLVDPYDVGALMAAMRQLDGDPGLGATMSARGLEQAKLFSRERYQQRLTELYSAAMGGQ